MTSPRVIYGLIGGIACVTLLILGATWMHLIAAARPLPPPMEWVYNTELPTAPVCPGDMFTLTYGIRVNTPGTLNIYMPIRRAADHATVIAAHDSELGRTMDDPNYTWVGDTVVAGDYVYRTVFAGDEVPAQMIDPDTRFVVPDLPPGPYQRMLVATVEGKPAEEALLRQNFTISANCD